MSFGHFEGEVITKWLKDDDDKDRTMELMEDFSYVDPAGTVWTAAKGRTVDGATIPAVFWSGNLGSPFVGDYRRATVLHDIGCQDKTEPHRAVHLMFYNAMRCDGESFTKANLMYQAVKRFGPKWGPGVAFALPQAASAEDVSALETAVAQAVEELGEEAGIEAIDSRVNEILAE